MNCKKILSVVLVIALLIPGAVMAEGAETSANLVIDPGFESGLVDNYFDGWKNYNASETDENATSVILSSDKDGYKASPTGGNYVCMTDSASQTAQVQHYISMDDTKDNRYYEFSTWYRYALTGTGIKANAVNAKVLIRVRIGSEVYTYITLPLNATGGEWVKASTVFFVPSGTTNIIIDLLTGKISDNSSICYDGVSVEAVGGSNVNFLGSAGNMEETRTVTVDEGTAQLPAHIKVFKGYGTAEADTYKTGVEGKNYLTVTLDAGETHNGAAGKAFKMVSDGEDDASAGLSAILNFQAAAGRADSSKRYDIPRYILSGYLKTEGEGYARVREEANVIAPNTQHKDNEAAYIRDTGKLYASGKWEYFEIPVTANIDGHKLQLEFYGKGSVIWDDLTLSPDTFTKTHDFEAVYSIDSAGSRKPAGFVDSVISSTAETVLSPYALDAASHAGTYALSVTAGNTFTLSDITGNSGELYKLSFWQKTTAGTKMKATLAAEEVSYACTFPASSAGWEYRTSYFTVPADFTNGTITIAGETGDAAFWLDDVSVQKVDAIPTAVEGVYTENGRNTETVPDGTVVFHGTYAGTAMAVTAVYTEEKGIKTLQNIKVTPSVTSTENDGWIVPSHFKNEILVGNGTLVKSFLLKEAAKLTPVGDAFVLPGTE